MNADEFFAAREKRTAERVSLLTTSFAGHLGADGAAALGEDGCIYLVGSAGRGEMGNSSDLDLFLVTHAKPRKVDEILAQAAVLRMMREHALPDPSNDADFLRLYAAQNLERRLGAVQDDPENTFTARMLLLLESRPLYGQQSYARLVDRVLQAYWRNDEWHANDYLPLVLVNDIVRYWRVVVLNYEAKFERKRLQVEESAKDAAELAVAKTALEQEKRFAGYKLRFSRSMTCYSMIARLLAETAISLGQRAHVSKAAMRAMVDSTPVRRLQQVRALAVTAGEHDTVRIIDEMLVLYREYLEIRERPDADVKALFGVAETRREHFKKSDRFGERMFDLLQRLGSTSPMYRYVVA